MGKGEGERREGEDEGEVEEDSEDEGEDEIAWRLPILAAVLHTLLSTKYVHTYFVGATTHYCSTTCVSRLSVI